MSGHSHWATIKRSKGAADAKRGKVFSKLSRAIIIAARAGGGDPEMNLRLRYAIDKARQVSMPKDNIERAIKRATGEGGDTHYEELSYEGYGSGGIAIYVEAATDNRNRTAGEVRKIFEKCGGKMGSAGNVAWMFDRKGLITIDAKAIDEDKLMEIALDAGADDVKNVGGHFEVLCDPAHFTKVQEGLAKNNVTTTSAEMSYVPKTPHEVDTETAKKVLRLMEALDEHEDVQNVYSDMHLTEELVAAAGAE